MGLCVVACVSCDKQAIHTHEHALALMRPGTIPGMQTVYIALTLCKSSNAVCYQHNVPSPGNRAQCDHITADTTPSTAAGDSAVPVLAPQENHGDAIADSSGDKICCPTRVAAGACTAWGGVERASQGVPRCGSWHSADRCLLPLDYHGLPGLTGWADWRGRLGWFPGRSVQYVMTGGVSVVTGCHEAWRSGYH